MNLEGVQSFVENALDPSAIRATRLAGIIGSRPSQYAKSPSLWNAVFRDLGVDAAYLPFDVDESKLPGLVDTLRRMPQFLGCNVTVPYKIGIIEYLDGLDESARRVGAVNTVVRTEDGRLIGCNTDGTGFIQSLTTPLLPGEEPLLSHPKGVDVLIIGAGGAARAVGFGLAKAIGSGRLYIVNRSREGAAVLADSVNRVYGNAVTVPEEDIGEIACSVGLVVNCSIKGQSGIRKLSGGHAVILEPYSALAQARPVSLPYTDGPEFFRRWLEASLPDIERNNHLSIMTALRMPSTVAAYDVIYSPLETVFLRHCRLAGHRTANGKGMNIAQAVDGLFHNVCHSYFHEVGLDTDDTYRRIINVMVNVW